MVSRTLVAGGVFLVIGVAAAATVALLDRPTLTTDQRPRTVSALASDHCSRDEQVLNRTPQPLGAPLPLLAEPASEPRPLRSVVAATVEPLCRHGRFVKVISHAVDGTEARGWVTAASLEGDDGLVTGALPAGRRDLDALTLRTSDPN